MSEGYVYIIKDVSVTGYHKIGRTNNPVRRLKEFSVKLPFETEVVMLIKSPDAATFEKTLHKFLAYCRVRGEWFNLGTDELNYLSAMYEYTQAWNNLARQQTDGGGEAVE